MKVHIKDNGELERCSATKRKCPYQDATPEQTATYRASELEKKGFLTFERAQEAFDDEALMGHYFKRLKRKKDPWDIYDFNRRIWDSYFDGERGDLWSHYPNAPRMPKGARSTQQVLNNAFGHEEGYEPGKPFGDFKKLKNIATEDNYNDWLERLMRERVTNEGEEATYIDIMYEHHKDVFGRIFPGATPVTKNFYTQVTCLYLLRMAEGLKQEGKFIKGFNKRAASHNWEERKTNKNREALYMTPDYDPAAEFNDVDAYIARGDIALCRVSIKSLGAIENLDRWVKKAMKLPGHKRPHVIMGMREDGTIRIHNIKKGKDLTWDEFMKDLDTVEELTLKRREHKAQH